MSNSSKFKLFIVALFAGGAATFMVLAPVTGAAGIASDDPSSPRALYVQNCARCHGSDGKANTRLGHKYKADDITGGVGVNKIIRIVTNGKGHMPSFKKRLTAQQISQIASYVSSL